MTRETLFRLLICAAPLCFFGALGAMLVRGDASLYAAILSHMGFSPYAFPFLDLHALLAAADCHRQGIDVYLSDPCDVLNRPHVYSPLWFDILPDFLNRETINPIGVILDLLFILSLPLIIRPRSWRECLFSIAAALSTTVIYALERANNDIVIFLLMVGAGRLFAGARGRRLAAYAIFLLGGLLKFYPLAVLVLVVRESWHTALVVVAVSVIAVLTLWWAHGQELMLVLQNLPKVSHYADSISAQNLPLGIFLILPAGLASEEALATMAFVILLALSALLVLRIFRVLEQNQRIAEGWGLEEAHLLIGAILLTGCFFAGENISYRGIFLLLTISGLLRLREAAGTPGARRMVGAALLAILGLLWEQRVGLALNHLPGGSFGPGNPNLAEGLVGATYWVCRELLWWALISFFTAIIMSQLSRMPLAANVALLLSRRASIGGDGREGSTRR
ncbi:MAG TPA: glycosyltransferase 87 family protein [Stellaceae bacterium]|nr:glycosyltransferase 87 family protein [Stellaceae bacterium]